jgi:hypothetical protein
MESCSRFQDSRLEASCPHISNKSTVLLLSWSSPGTMRRRILEARLGQMFNFFACQRTILLQEASRVLCPWDRLVLVGICLGSLASAVYCCLSCKTRTCEVPFAVNFAFPSLAPQCTVTYNLLQDALPILELQEIKFHLFIPCLSVRQECSADSHHSIEMQPVFRKNG